MAKRDSLEYKFLQYILKNGEGGVLQSRLWREMGATSREGSRIALKLEERGLIQRKRELYNGRWTYRLYPTRQPKSIDSILDCPCLTCPESNRCGAGGEFSPNNCEKLTNWILGVGREEMNPSGDS
ncbi:MAG: transcriptional regulator [Thermoproteota archaeon]|nr:transcriptional regulator [Thermoproteota archaeon]